VTKPARIGVYGGTYDPIHQTHLDIARTALRHARLDQVLFVVAASPPHKRGGVFAGAEDRLALVEAALASEPRMAACRLEVDRPGPSYTADTLQELARQHPHAAFFLILGSDSLVDLPRWRDPETILRHARILVVRRPDAPVEAPPELDGRFELLPFAESAMSSTVIRRRLADGEDVSAEVPRAALALIEEKGLYDAYRKRSAL